MASSKTPSPLTDVGDASFDRWLDEQRRGSPYAVRRAPLDALPGWHFCPDTGDLVHSSGRFFTVSGLRATTDFGGEGQRPHSWTQPVIVQREVGLLGMLLKEFDGEVHCLLQAKMEPGNLNGLQLSPTVQATRSNFMGVHRGRRVPYTEFFTGDRRGGRVLADSLQSEQGWWFLHKRNRNVVVMTDDDVPALEGFRWLSLRQVGALLRRDHLVNMDSRTVLSTLPRHLLEGPGRLSLPAGEDEALHSFSEVLSALADTQFRYELAQEQLPLRQVLESAGSAWRRTRDGIGRSDGRHFTVLGVSVQARAREVASWSQPLLAPVAGLAGLLVRRVAGVPHVLLRARVEAGSLNVAEFGPTVQCSTRHLHGRGGRRPEFLDALVAPRAGRVLFDTEQSEEGGRFHRAVTRNLIVELDEADPVNEAVLREVPPDFCWVSVPQAQALLRHGNYLNVQARCLMTALTLTRPARPGA
ncbi:NDP-hexose 2,3-dehydratase [Streptomyces sp. SID14478]|uniref:NDP-hexose 2,3-dehydratase family protein n=1 Tax=Streptomyces sp. SID14478 TaxID=2706073 RepID=UPI0013DA5D3F|nr:NDP-hexose 2,3-dehydratase family protein [Streptomyces sp. SID14478]NEB76598.1 NDP-hexose 2,3-dehydratase [Streptomyces sp. SID14478]